jgi:hypothetical protein
MDDVMGDYHYYGYKGSGKECSEDDRTSPVSHPFENEFTGKEMNQAGEKANTFRHYV